MFNKFNESTGIHDYLIFIEGVSVYVIYDSNNEIFKQVFFNEYKNARNPVYKKCY